MEKEDYSIEYIKLRHQIDEFWFQVENSYDIEPRTYFEERYPMNPLGMAVHYMWKRDVRERKAEAPTEKAEGRKTWIVEDVRDSEDLDDGC